MLMKGALTHTEIHCYLMAIIFLGGEIVSTFGRPELVKLGECKVIEEVMIGEDKVSSFLS